MFVLGNETAILECVVIVPTTDASAKIGWIKTKGANRGPISDFAAGNSILSIMRAQEQHAGEYRCNVVTDYSGQHSAFIRLVVVSKLLLMNCY